MLGSYPPYPAGLRRSFAIQGGKSRQWPASCGANGDVTDLARPLNDAVRKDVTGPVTVRDSSTQRIEDDGRHRRNKPVEFTGKLAATSAAGPRLLPPPHRPKRAAGRVPGGNR